MKDEKPNDRLGDLNLPEDDGDEAEVYALQNLGSAWNLSRRDVMTAVGAVAAGVVATQSEAQAPYCTGGVAHTDAIVALAVTSDGSQLFSVAWDNFLKIWKLPEGAYKQTIQLSTRPSCIAVNPVNTVVAVGLITGSIRITNLSSGTGPLWSPHTSIVRALAYSPDGRFLASCGDDQNVHLLSVSSGDKVVTDKNEAPTALAFTPDSEFLIVGYASGAIRILSVPDFVALDVSIKHSVAVTSLVVSLDGAILASASLDDTAKLWSLPAGGLIRTLSHPGYVNSVAIEYDFLITSCADAVWRTWSFPSGALIRSSAPGVSITSIAVGSSADGGRVVTSTGGSLRLWALSDSRSLLDCMIDLAVSSTSAQGTRYTQGGITYTLPCGSPIPTGATCTCNCVSNCSCVSNTCTCVSNTCTCVSNTCGCVGNCSCNSVGHYWYPN